MKKRLHLLDNAAANKVVHHARERNPAVEKQLIADVQK